MKRNTILPLVSFGLTVLASTGFPQTLLTNGLVAYYPFNGNTSDESGSGNNGTGNNVGFTIDRFQVGNGAGAFAGDASSLVTIDTTNLNLRPPFAVSVWINPTAGLGTHGPRILSTAGYELGVSYSAGESLASSNRYIAMNVTDAGNAGAHAVSPVAIRTGTWNHGVGVWTTNGGTLYVNGEVVASYSTELLPDYSRGFVPTIGRNSGSVYDSYGGLIDDLRVYDRAFTDDEVKQLYMAEAPPPTIVLNPSARIVLVGTDATFGVSAYGRPPLDYQWYFNGLPIVDATNAAFSRPSCELVDSGLLQRGDGNPVGSVTSAPAKLWVTTNTFDLGMVAYYPFNGNAEDASGHNIDGTVAGATPAVDRFGNAASAYDYNGIDNYISASIPEIPSGGAPRTISAWIRPARPVMQDAALAVMVYGAGIYNSLFGLALSPGQGTCFWGGHADFCGPSLAPVNKWTFVVMTLTNGMVGLSVDGVEYQWRALALNTANNGRLFLGTASIDGLQPSWPAGNWDRWFAGGIDDVRVYNRSLSDNEVSQLYMAEAPPPTIVQNPSARIVLAGTDATFGVSAYGRPPLSYQWYFNGSPIADATNSTFSRQNCGLADSGFCSVVITNPVGSVTSAPAKLWVTTNSFDVGMIAYYPFNGNANDETGNGHHGIVHGATTTPGRFGTPGGAFSFNGTNGYITAAIADLPAGAAPRSMTGWIKLARPQDILSALGYGAGNGSGQFGLGIGCYSIEQDLYFWKGHTEWTSRLGVRDNLWSFVAATYSNQLLTVWLDNSNATWNVALDTSNNQTLFLGAVSVDGQTPSVPSPDFNVWFAGEIDDVRVYDRALTSDEIRQLRDFEFPDADHDGLSDYEEINLTHTNPEKADTENDGLSDYREVRIYGTDPLKPDTDGDGYNDYAEIYAGKKPNDINDHPAAHLAAFTAIELEFISKTNTSYYIQASPDLITWTNFEGPILGDGNIWKKLYSTRGAGKSYYRVELAP